MTYFKDILVYFVAVMTHREHLRMIMEVLWRKKLYINMKSVVFFRVMQSFQGFIVDVDQRFKPLQNNLCPRQQVKLRVFIGWQHYIGDIFMFLEIQSPLLQNV